MPNMQALEQALTQIKDHPETHYQQVWACETGACLAGHGLLQQGYVITPMFGWLTKPQNWFMVESLYHQSLRIQAEEHRLLWMDPGEDRDCAWQRLVEDRQRVEDRMPEVAVYAPDAARELFGITYADSDILFYHTNTAATLELMIKDLGNGNSLSAHWHNDHSFEYERMPTSDELQEMYEPVQHCPVGNES